MQPVLEQEIEELEQELQLLEKPKPEEPPEQSDQRALQRQQKGRPVVGVWRARSGNLLKKGGVLVGGIFTGGGLFRRAFDVTILPTLRQIMAALNIPADLCNGVVYIAKAGLALSRRSPCMKLLFLLS